MRDAKTRRIGEHEYTVHMIAPRVAYPLYLDIAKAIAPALEAGAAAMEPGKPILDQQVARVIGAAVSTLLKNIDGPLALRAIEAFAPKTLVDGKLSLAGAAFDGHFAGNMVELTMWLGFAIEANFGDFTFALPDLVAKLDAIAGAGAKKPGKAVPSPSPST